MNILHRRHLFPLDASKIVIFHGDTLRCASPGGGLWHFAEVIALLLDGGGQRLGERRRVLVLQVDVRPKSRQGLLKVQGLILDLFLETLGEFGEGVLDLVNSDEVFEIEVLSYLFEECIFVGAVVQMQAGEEVVGGCVSLRDLCLQFRHRLLILLL